MPNNFSQSERGVVILFAVLLVSVVLTISLGVFNITYRQLVLSSIARESEIAFSVADSARNCAIYWNSIERVDGQHPFYFYKYDTTSGLTTLASPDLGAGPNCGGSDWGVTSTADSSAQTDLFQMTLAPDPAEPTRLACAEVRVVKKLVTPSDQDQITTITVDGYNTAASGGTGCVPTNLNRAVQRTIETVIIGG